MTTPLINTKTATICAIATPIGAGGVGIVRISGDKAYEIGQKITQKPRLTPRFAHFCKIYDGKGDVLDEAVVLYFKAPHSFTGEDVLEIQGHGGMVVQNLILARCFELGARQATAGEFSFRAFDNNKLDLVQAESIADMISATSIAQAKSAMRSLSGEFSSKVNDLLEVLINIRLYVESAIDFSDEEGVEFLSDGVLQDKLANLIKDLKTMLASTEQGLLLKNGVQAVIAGRPNAGKSSLLNRLAGSERAIVTPIAGTTRDTLQESVILKGLTVHLTDTAGLRQTADVVEQIGIDRAKGAIERADLLILVYDLSQGEDRIALAHELFGDIKNKNILFVGNKADLTAHKTGKIAPNAFNVSCETLGGLDELVDGLCELVGFYPNDSTPLARTRHIDGLRRVLAFCNEAYEQLTVYQAGELSAESLRLAQNALAELTGEFSSDDLLGRIFSEFCIGK